MSRLRLTGSTSGYTELSAPASAGNNTLILPTGNGVAGNILGTDGAGNLSWVNGRMALETAKASTSGTSVEFTGIPSWAKRITVILSQVSTSGTADPFQLQLGTSSGFIVTGYNATSIISGGAVLTSTVGLLMLNIMVNTNSYSGLYTIINVTGNTWVGMGSIIQCSGVSGASNQGGPSTGQIALAGALDRLRVIASTTGSPTSTFDAGNINILYEG